MSYLDSGNSTILTQQARRESNARTYPRHLPLAVRGAQGVTMTDMDGNEYYDCLAGAGTLARCFERGLIIERGGRESATARFLPPLVVSKAQVDDIAAIFDKAVTATTASVDDTEVAA